MSLIKKVKAEDLKTVRAKRVSRFRETPHWKKAVESIEAGIEPGLGFEFAWPDEMKKKYNLWDRRTLSRCLQKHIDKLGLPYRATILQRDGEDFIGVSYPKPKK